MKHLIHKKHHAHLKKRALLELGGLLLLVAVSLSQREVVNEAVKTVSRVEAVWFLLLLGVYWVALPLTAISYRLISPKPQKLRLGTTTLAHLAGAGPGRIIPGGIGSLSISAMHLKKCGLSIEQALAVVVTNNLIGFFANLLLVVSVLLIRPETWRVVTDNISSQQLIIAIGIVVALVVLLQWLLHARKTHRELVKAFRQWKIIVQKFLRSPKHVLQAVLLGVIITLVHTIMLDFSAYALLIDLTFTDALIALGFGVAIGSIFPTPGGIGGVEAGTTAALVVLGYDGATATSIAVLYRVATYWQPLIPGTLAYLYLRERRLV